MPTRHRIPSIYSEVTRFLALRLRSALLEVSGALRCRPEPRDAWDSLGGKDADLRTLWLDKPVAMCRSALAAAELEGPAVFAETARRVERFYGELLAASFHGFERKSGADLRREVLELQHEIAQASAAAADAQFEGTDASLEQLRFEALDVIAEAKDVVSLTSHRLAARPARLATT
jgi:hypothetical protein